MPANMKKAISLNTPSNPTMDKELQNLIFVVFRLEDAVRKMATRYNIEMNYTDWESIRIPHPSEQAAHWEVYPLVVAKLWKIVNAINNSVPSDNRVCHPFEAVLRRACRKTLWQRFTDWFRSLFHKEPDRCKEYTAISEAVREHYLGLGEDYDFAPFCSKLSSGTGFIIKTDSGLCTNSPELLSSNQSGLDAQPESPKSEITNI